MKSKRGTRKTSLRYSVRLCGSRLNFTLQLSLSTLIGQLGDVSSASSSTFLDVSAQYPDTLGIPASAIDINAALALLGIDTEIKDSCRRRQQRAQSNKKAAIARCVGSGHECDLQRGSWEMEEVQRSVIQLPVY